MGEFLPLFQRIIVKHHPFDAYGHIRTWGGGSDLLARKNYTMPKCVSVEIER